MIRQPEPFKVAYNPGPQVGPEVNPWFWNPRMAGIRFAPESFRERFKREMGQELEITWNPRLERWQVWTQANIDHPICQGWRLLFIHNGPSGEYLPLDERVFARLFAASAAKWGSGREYFDAVEREYWREKEKQEATNRQDAIDLAMPYFEHSQIKVAMRGKSSGDKFSTYHA